MAQRRTQQERGKGSTKVSFKEPDDDEDDIDIDDDADDEIDIDADDDDTSGKGDNDEDEDDEELGEGGKKALRAERRKTRELERELRAERRKNGTRAPDKKRTRDDPKNERDEDDKPRGPSERETRIESRLKKTSLSAELISAGVSKSNARLLVGQAKLSDLELDDDDEVDSRDLDDMVANLKDEYPDLFGSKSKRDEEDEDDDEDPADRRRRMRQRGGSGRSRREPSSRAPKDSADVLAEQMFGKGGGRSR